MVIFADMGSVKVSSMDIKDGVHWYLATTWLRCPLQEAWADKHAFEASSERL
jgi:hypothetical protein